MKKIFTKQNILPVVVLGTICLVVAALLGAVNMITAPVIEDAKNQAANEALLVVLPEGKTFDEIELTEDYPTEIKKAYKSDAGYVFEVNTRGKETMTVMCGVDNDGKIVKVTVLSEQETPGYKEKVLPFVTGDEGKYNGKGSDSLEPELFSGATLTSNGVYNAVKTSLNGYAVATGGEADELEDEALPKTDDELILLATEIVGEGSEFTDVTPEGMTLVKRIYKENSGKGYVAYTVSISENYGTVDTENLIYIGNDGKIFDVEKLTWSVSPANPEWGYNPPSDEFMTEFYQGLVGKDSATINEVDLKTGATNTTTTLVNSISEALTSVERLIKNDMPTPEEEVKDLASKLVGEETALTDVTPKSETLVKRLYRRDDGKGYVAYLVAISPNYGTVETETLVSIDDQGKIAAVKRLTWKVSDAKPEWGYNPPSDEEVAAFYQELVGKDSVTIGDVDLKTGVTNTTERLVGCIAAALECIDELDASEQNDNNIAKIVGIVGIAAIVLVLAACVVAPKIIRRRKNG